MNRGVDHQPIFFGDEDRIEFGRRLTDCHARFGLELLAYCLMGNHYHLVARTPDGGLSAAMHHLATTYVRHTNDRVGRDGPLFRSRFTSIPVTTDTYLRQLVRYVHLNPLALPGVERPEDHRWSSYRAYLGRRPPAHFLKLDLVMSLFGGKPDRLAAFTVGAGSSPGIIPSTADEMMNVVKLALDDQGEPSSGARERVVLAALLDRLGDDRTGQLVAAALQFPSADARRTALSRSRKRVRDDPKVAGVVDRLTRQLERAEWAA